MCMAKRFAYVKTEEFTGWVCSECGWQYRLLQDPSNAELAAAEKALQDHLEQKHHEGPLNRTFGQSV
jgi:hypothetical protein